MDNRQGAEPFVGLYMDDAARVLSRGRHEVAVLQETFETGPLRVGEPVFLLLGVGDAGLVAKLGMGPDGARKACLVAGVTLD